MDVVIQFAIQKLGFQLSDIVIYAWSIGGFTGAQTPHRTEQPLCNVLLFPVGLPCPCSLSLSFHSHVGSDVLPRRQGSGAGCVL